MNFPLLVFIFSFIVLWLSTRVGTFLLRRGRLEADVRDDFGTILAAALTLLGLIIGFSFSMAVNRYDQRKNYEAEEANAIGTEYSRADLLPTADAARVKALLRDYLDQRVLFYASPNYQGGAQQINARTTELQNQLWAAMLPAAQAQPTPTIALALAGMNDVLNSQAYSQAAWWNRIPLAAWTLMGTIAVVCNVMIGFGARNVKTETRLLPILPLIVSISFFLIADIDSPNGGVIRVSPQNLESLAESLHSH